MVGSVTGYGWLEIVGSLDAPIAGTDMSHSVCLLEFHVVGLMQGMEPRAFCMLHHTHTLLSEV